MLDNKGRQLRQGDMVVIYGQSHVGKVVSVANKYAVVAFQAIEIRIPLSMLKKAEVAYGGSQVAVPKKSPTKVLNLDVDAFSAFSSEIDLHGMSVHEALGSVDKWLDRASLLGHKRLKIIHGKGSGVLRRAVRSYLQTHSQVKEVIAQHPYPGGEGVTWLELN